MKKANITSERPIKDMRVCDLSFSIHAIKFSYAFLKKAFCKDTLSDENEGLKNSFKKVEG
jgi:hypothetical protein